MAGDRQHEESVERKILEYMRGHFGDEVREEWRVREEDYPGILKRVMGDFTSGASRGRRFFRIAGQSGSGKTSQLLPAVKEWFGRKTLVRDSFEPSFSEIPSSSGTSYTVTPAEPQSAKATANPSGQSGIYVADEEGGYISEKEVRRNPSSARPGFEEGRGVPEKEIPKNSSSARLSHEESGGIPKDEVSKGFSLARPVVVAARRFVGYHPFVREIREECGEENVRKMTDGVSTVLMFLTLRELIRGGYDIILDVALLDPLVEGALMEMLTRAGYETKITMVAVSREISERFTRKRSRIVAGKTAAEFWRATREAMRFYAERYPEMRVTLWSAWDLSPVYDGEFRGAVEVWEKYVAIRELPEGIPSEEELREAKIRYMVE